MAIRPSHARIANDQFGLLLCGLRCAATAILFALCGGWSAGQERILSLLLGAEDAADSLERLADDEVTAGNRGMLVACGLMGFGDRRQAPRDRADRVGQSLVSDVDSNSFRP